MKSIEERLEMLDEIIEDKTSDQLFEELIQFEPVGMKADAFIPISEARKKRNYDKFNTPVGERKYKSL